MDRNEFMTDPSDFGFNLDPLDMNLTKMQTKLLEAMRTARKICGVVFDSISETYVSRNPEREYDQITVEIYKDSSSYTGRLYKARIIITDKQGDLCVVGRLYKGYWDEMLQFIDGNRRTLGGKWDFFSLCKANTLWLDYCIRNNERQNLLEMNEALTEKLRKEVDRLYFYTIDKKVFCHGHPGLVLQSGFPIGEGMAIFENNDNPSMYIVNTATNEMRQLVDSTGHVVGFKEEDFDREKLKQVEHRRCLDDMVIDYGGIGRYSDYHNGLCCINWMLYPDGIYFADEDGFGVESNDEEKIYCIIDNHLRVLIPWQPMTSSERKKLMWVAACILETLN